MTGRTGTALAVTVLLALAVLAALNVAEQDGAAERAQEEDEPGRFDYYSLVLSWSPSYCAGLATPGADPQCRRNAGKPYAFVLHGLWPQYEQGYPLSCATGSDTWVPRAVIEGMRDLMPNPKLVIHEYRRHGTCSGLDPAHYFGLARKLAESIKVPPRFLEPDADQVMSTADVIAQFLSANPTLARDMIAVSCGGPGPRLRDVRFCFTREGAPRRCGANENPQRLCRADYVHVPPLRPTPP
ncbi:MAG TPA: ribonuclease T2 [Hyphomicrobiaceae bacterium]|nr:ribonuclease T2 [Hyphomicrobiaceae bacterium]